MNANPFHWKETPQLSLVQFFLAFLIPSGIGLIGFHVLLPALVANGWPSMVAWLTVASVMLAGLLLVAIVLSNREAKILGISLWTRLCMKRLSLREWGLYILLMIAALVATIAAQSLVLPFMDALGLSVPDYMPFFLNPAIDPATNDMSIVSPGLPLQGRYGLLPLLGLTLLLNILTEEFYFRAWMLPKLSRYGSWCWAMNGVFFALYHMFQIWLLPVLLVASLFFAFIFYKSRSVWPPLAAHLIGNFLLQMLGISMLIVR